MPLIGKTRSIAVEIEDDLTSEAILNLCEALENAQNEIKELKRQIQKHPNR